MDEPEYDDPDDQQYVYVRFPRRRGNSAESYLQRTHTTRADLGPIDEIVNYELANQLTELGVTDFMVVAVSNDPDLLYRAPPVPAASEKLVLRGRLIALDMDGKAYNCPQVTIEFPSTKYPLRMPHTEGAQNGRPNTTWVLPLKGSAKHFEWRDVRGLCGEAVKITVERDHDANT